MSADQTPPLESPRDNRQLIETLELVRDNWGRLTLVGADGERTVDVAAVPLFPTSDPGLWISICDGAGRELVCIPDPEQLPPKSREVLREELSRRAFMPLIQRILHVSGNAEPTEWRVATDRGETRFALQSDDQVRLLGEQKVMIIDANGVRYLIPNYHDLDAKSRRIIEWYV